MPDFLDPPFLLDLSDGLLAVFSRTRGLAFSFRLAEAEALALVAGIVSWWRFASAKGEFAVLRAVRKCEGVDREEAREVSIP